MRISISKSQLRGQVTAPASKSYTIRGLMAAALAQGDSIINSPLAAEDTLAARNVLSGIGVTVKPKRNAWHISGGRFHAPEQDLYCGDSAATLRFMTAIAALVPGRSRLTAGPSLAKRPVQPLITALKQLGVTCEATNGFAPVTVCEGLAGGTTELPGNISSQYISALLLAAPGATAPVTIRLSTPPESKPYILMTLDCLRSFGIDVNVDNDYREYHIAPQVYRPDDYKIEGDWSSASYFLASGAISGPVTVGNLNPGSRQGDKIMLDFLRDMGARITIDKDTVTVRKSRLNAISADLTDCIDLLPTMAVLAAVADGATELHGIARARIKESNRVAAMSEGLRRMGVAVTEDNDQLIITGGGARGAEIDPRQDHRIAMAFSVLATVAGETVINEAECVAKTFPDYWGVLSSIGGKVKKYEQ